MARKARRQVKSRSKPKRAARRAKPTRKAVTARTSRRSSTLRIVSRPVKRSFKNRFAKFYWLHRDDFNSRRKRLYHARKRGKDCVKCGNKRVGKSIFCTTHLRTSRIYNRRARAR